MSAVTKPIVLDETFAAKMDLMIAAMQRQYYTVIVTANTKDNVTVSGQTVTVREGGASGVVYKTASYMGQPVSITLPEGFHYYIEISDTLYRHFNPTHAEGIIAGADAAVTLVYSDLAHIQTAADIQAALNADTDLSGLVGTTIECSKGEDTITWEIAEFADNEVTMLSYDTLPTQMQFDKPQALAWFESGLAAGDYCFKHSNTYYYFTLTEDIPPNGQLRATTTAFETYENQNTTETIETGVVSTTAITGATDLGTTGSETGTYPLNHMDRVNYGSNNMVEGVLNTWLNSSQEANVPINRVTKFGRAYVAAIPGFLKDLDPEFLAVIADTEWKCATNTTYECPASMGGLTTKGQRYSYTAKFSLASEKEIFGVQTGTNVEAGDHVLQLYKNASASDRIKRYSGTARYWWLRSPSSNAHHERYVGTSGAVSYYNATSTHGVVPACKIRKSV